MNYTNQIRNISKVLRIKNKKNPKSGYSIYFRVTTVINNICDEFEISSRVSLSNEKEWDMGRKVMKGTSDTTRRLNKKLRDFETIIDKAWENVCNNNRLSVDFFKAEIYKAMGVSKRGIKTISYHETILSLFDHAIEMKRLTITLKRKQRYEMIKSRIAQFLQETYGKIDVRHTELGSIFYTKFKNFLVERIKIKQQSTLEGQMKVLKAVANQALRDELISKNPFINCKSEKIEYAPRSLEFDEYMRLEDCDEAKLDDELKKTLWWFLIQCNTGLSHGDLENIGNIMEKIGGHWFLIGARRKTKVKFNVWVRPNVLELLQKLCTTNGVNSWNNLIPVSLHTMNEKLKIIMAHCKIKKNLTTHVGRHTYGSGYVQNGGSLQILSDGMGHKDLEQTRHYARNNNYSSATDGEKVYKSILEKKAAFKKQNFQMN